MNQEEHEKALLSIYDELLKDSLTDPNLHIRGALKRLCLNLSADIAYLFLFSFDQSQFGLKAYWIPPPDTILPDTYRELNSRDYQEILSPIMQKKASVNGDSLLDGNSLKPSDQMLISEFKNSINFPLIHQNRGIGFVGVANRATLLRVDGLKKSLMQNASNALAAATNRLRALSLLQKSEAQFKSIFDHSGEALIISNQKGMIIDANTGMSTLSGYNQNELIGFKTFQLFGPSSSLTSAPENPPAIVREEQELTHKKGHRIPVMVTKSLLPNGLASIIIIDISLRKRYNDELLSKNKRLAETETLLKTANENLTSVNERLNKKSRQTELAFRELEQSEKKYRLLFESSADAILIIKHCRILDCNFKSVELFGTSKSDIIGKTFYEFCPERQMDEIPSKDKCDMLFEDAFAGNQVKTDWILRRLSQELVEVEMSLNKVIFGGEVYIQLALRDISEEKKTLDQLRRSETKFRLLFQNSSDAMTISNTNGQIIDANASFCKTVGISKVKLGKINSIDLIDPKYHEELMERISRLKEGESLPPMEIQYKSTDGKTLYFEFNSTILDFEKEHVILTIFRDITFRKEIDNKIVDTIVQTEEKERKRIAEDLHDELGPLLSGIKLYIDQLSDLKLTTEERNDKIGYLKQTVDEAVMKTRQLSEALMPNVLMDYGLVKAIESLVYKTNRIEKAHVRFKEKITQRRFPERIEIIIYRIIGEMINNSLKHSHANNILITLKEIEGHLIFSFEEDGEGFDFERALNEPIGLGLKSMVQRVKGLHGELKYETDKDKGYRYIFDIPLNLSARNLK